MILENLVTRLDPIRLVVFPGFFTGQDPARGSGQEVFLTLAGLVGSGQRRCSKSHWSGGVGSGGFPTSRVGSGDSDPTRPDPTRPEPTRPDPTRPDPTRPDRTGPAGRAMAREKPWTKSMFWGEVQVRSFLSGKRTKKKGVAATARVVPLPKIKVMCLLILAVDA